MHVGVLELMSAAREREVGGEEQPVLVVSADGVSRAGVYCALSYVRDQAGRTQGSFHCCLFFFKIVCWYRYIH